MSSNLMERIPGTAAWIRATFTPRVQLKMRDELRKMLRVTGALALVVWIDADGGDLIAFAGSFSALPDRLPLVDATVATVLKVTINGERLDLVAQVVQLGRGLPSLRLVAVDPETIDDSLIHAIEDCAARLEHIAVAALSAKA